MTTEEDETTKRRDRTQIAKIAANTRWANEPDRSAATSAARAGMARKFEDQVDPDRSLAPEERARRVDSARRAHYQRLALKSAQSRRAKRAIRQKAAESESPCSDDTTSTEGPLV